MLLETLRLIRLITKYFTCSIPKFTNLHTDEPWFIAAAVRLPLAAATTVPEVVPSTEGPHYYQLPSLTLKQQTRVCVHVRGTGPLVQICATYQVPTYIHALHYTTYLL